MIEAAVEQDDDAMMEYLEGEEPDVADDCANCCAKVLWLWTSCRFWAVRRSKTKVSSRC